MKTKGLVFTVIAALVLTGAMLMNPSTAQASMIYSLGSPNLALSPYTGPYATVEVDLINSTTADITASSLTSGDLMYLMGDGGILGLNVSGTPTIVGGLAGISESNILPGFTPGPAVDIGSGNVNGHGDFNLVIKNFDGWSSSASSISFQLTSSGVNWTDASEVLIANSLGYSAVSHIFVADTTDLAAGALVTGYAGDGTGPSPVPEPATILLLGSGVLALTRIRKRLKSKS